MEAALHWMTDRNHGGIETLRADPDPVSISRLVAGRLMA
jgi:hypothetical protein